MKSIQFGLVEVDFASSYNGSSDLQLERMNVYFNEVHGSHRSPLECLLTSR